MKKISLMMMALLAAVTMSATVVTFDFSNPTSMGLTPSSKTSDGVLLNSDTIIVGDVAMSFGNTTGNGAKLWTAKGPVYSLRLYTPSQMILTSSGDNIRGIRVARTQGDITELDENSEWRGDAKSVTLSVPDKGKANYITVVTVYVGEEMPTPKVDTVSVTEARQRIDAKNLGSCYIKAVVASAPFVLNDRNCVWLTDIENPGDSLEGYGVRKGKATSATYPSLDSMAVDFGLQDTVLVFADALKKFDTTYEFEGGCYVSTIGKSQAINANEVFPYAFGAVRMEMVESSYRYEIVLSKEEDDYENSLHYVIRTSNENGIAGTYSANTDSSYVDGEGQVTGSLKIAFVSEGNYPNNIYSIKGDFMVGGLKYRMDTTYSLAGYPDPDSDEPFKLEDDVPFIPQEGDTLTCAVAAKYALTVLAENETSKINVFVLGYANNVGEISSNQQTCYMDDEASETKTLQSYYGNLSGKKITAGSQVLIYGKMMHYSKNSSHVAEMKNGIVQVLQGGTDVPDRGLTYENLPAGAITVAQAKALCDNLVGVDTTEEVTVKGYVVDIYKTWNSTSKQQSFYMGDEYVIGVKTHFEAFNANLAAGVMVGDKMFVTGRVTKYNDSYNLVQGTGHFTSSLTKLNEMVKSAPQGKVQKVFCNGAIYIIREGVAYDLQGNVMK